MKRVLKALTVLLVIWLGFTFYFITQHSVVGKAAKINKTVVFDDVTIELDNMVFYNFKRKRPNFDTNYGTEIKKFKYKLLPMLPNSVLIPYSRIRYLYCSPFEIDKSYTIALFGKCMFTHHINDSTEYNESKEYNDYFRDNLSIYMVDSTGLAYSNGTSSTFYEDNSHELVFSTKGQNLSIVRFQEGMKVIIKHLGSGEVREFKIDSQDFINFKHNDSFGKAFPFGHSWMLY